MRSAGNAPLIKLFLFCAALFTGFAARSQGYGNEWVDHSLTWYKFPLYKEGIHRIDSAVLGKRFNLSMASPDQFCLFFKGKEQRLYVHGAGDGKINTGDYIEFYANPIAGDIDSLLYSGIGYVPNPYGALFNDTIYAFLTLRPSQPNLRYTVETDTNSSAYPAASYFYTDRRRSFKDKYNRVLEFGGLVSDPRYTQQEGWGNEMQKGAFRSAAFSQLNVMQSPTLNCYFAVNYSGMSKSNTIIFDHEMKVQYRDAGNNVVDLADTVFNGFAAIRQTFTISSQNIGNASDFTVTSVASPSFAAFNNSTLLHYMWFFYPHVLNLNGQPVFRVFADDAGSAGKQYFQLLSVNTGTTGTVQLYDITNGRKIATVTAGSAVKAVIPNGSGRKFCYLSAESSVMRVDSLLSLQKGGTFTNYRNAGAVNPYVIIHHASLLSSASAYRNYRQSAAGGSYQVVLADVDELYEQFSGGNRRNPVAIRNFIRFMYDSLPARPKYVLLLGKGTHPADFNTSNPQNLVPTMGVPACDNLLVTGISSGSVSPYAPDIPIGRVASLNNAELNAYLQKVQQHDATGQEEWKKKVLHFVGGANQDQVNEFSSYMADYQAVISDSLYGGEVYTFKKTSAAPIQVNISDSIKNMVSRGASLLSFFGHGSSEGFDQAIDNPENYNNAGKYFFLIANSCFSGDIHSMLGKSVSERFVLTPQKGSIGFLASTSFGYVHALNNFSRKFYTALSYTKYNSGIGDIIREAAFQNATSGDMLTKLLSFDMTLHGDPAVKVTHGLLPDYQVRNIDVSFELGKRIDTVGMTIRMKNIGKAPSDSFDVRIERQFPTGDTLVILERIKAPMSKDSLKLQLAIDRARGYGLNKFTVSIDHFNRIKETIETNNSTAGTVDLFIPGGDLSPVYPYQFAIVPKTPTIALKCSTPDPFAPLTSYRLQVDTSDDFVDPFVNTVISSKGGVIEWVVPLPHKDSTVYFWRVSRDSTSPDLGYAWRESSFQTIGGKRGWGQAHFHQFRNDSYQYVSYLRAARKFGFVNNVSTIRAHTGIYPVVQLPAQSYYYNNIKMDDWSCTFDGWNFVLFDTVSGEPHEVVSVNWPLKGPTIHNSCACKDNTVYRVYGFGNYQESCDTTGWLNHMENFLKGIKPGTKVLAYTTGLYGNNYRSKYSNPLLSAFESIGATGIRSMTDTVPAIIFGRKSTGRGQGRMIVGSNRKAVLDLEDSIRSNWNDGRIASGLIGPSNGWHSLHWQVSRLEAAPGDTTVLKLVGIRSSGVTDTLATFPEDSSDVLDLSAYVNAVTHPYIRLVAQMKDNVHRTSPQLRRWQVLYEEVPECAINPLKGFAALNDSLQEGDDVKLVFPIENIGAETFTDSLLVTCWIENQARVLVPLPDRLKRAGFAAGEVIFDTVKVNSQTFLGNNGLWIHVNPSGKPRYQKEQFQFNNIARYAFKVSGDLTNPLLDVTFDGRRILNGDLVSAKPVILVSLKDENRFLALNDTGAFTILLKTPSRANATRIYFAQGLEFTAASLPANSAKIVYRPELTEDGRYSLVVQAADRSKNLSGPNSYQVDFEVQNKPSVTNVMNYPNPFTTRTHFVFTLTGSEVPEVFTIQIMTVTGKIVREITRAELGVLRIGRNITGYAWDGRDEFGDRLGNGVYLYRVLTKLNGENIEKSASGADRYFTKEFGKMVLMR